MNRLQKALKLGFCFALLVAPVHAETLHYLVIGSNVAPLQYDLNSGKRGIIGSILDSARGSSPVSTKQLPWPRQIEAIKTESINNWVIYASKNWLDFPAKFSVPLFDWNHVSIQTKDSGAEKESLVLVKNFDYPNLDKWLRKKSFEQIFFAPSPKSALTMIKKGRAQMYVGEVARINHTMNGLNMRIDDYNVDDLSNYIPNDQIFLAFDTSVSDETLNKINARILQMQREGAMKDILESHDWSTSYPIPE